MFPSLTVLWLPLAPRLPCSSQMLVSFACARPIAAGGLAPSPGAVLAGIQKEPIALGAASDQGETVRRQQVDRGDHDRHQHAIEVGRVRHEAELESMLPRDEFLMASGGTPTACDPRGQPGIRAALRGEYREELIHLLTQAMRAPQRARSLGLSIGRRSPKLADGLRIEEASALAPDEQIAVAGQAFSR